LAARLTRLAAAEGEVNLQLSGGEPTTRDDLPDIIAAAATAGISFIQLNTNGLRLADEPGYAESLRAAGLASVFLQFDGLSDDTYRAIRGRPLLAQKLRAVERCAAAGLAVVLVPTVVPGVNDRELGDLVRYAASWAGVVRGLHLQPMAYFGRYPAFAAEGAAVEAQNDAAPGAGDTRGRAYGGGLPRLTLPELLQALEGQTDGELRAADFAGSCCEHVRCSFRARYWVRKGGRLEPLRSASCGCDSRAVPVPARSSSPIAGPDPAEASRRAVAATARQWSPPGGGPRPPSAEDICARADTAASSGCCGPGEVIAAGGCRVGAAADDLSRFLADAERILAISGMLFQDAWSIDMERIDRCCVQVVTDPGEHAADGLVPFCLWNLTSASGVRLYPR
jgi:uncharacterized radical SAM superfamily Fe-S cluster-containing enzyme